jgi:hypothetical protein
LKRAVFFIFAAGNEFLAAFLIFAYFHNARSAMLLKFGILKIAMMAMSTFPNAKFLLTPSGREFSSAFRVSACLDDGHGQALRGSVRARSTVQPSSNLRLTMP